MVPLYCLCMVFIKCLIVTYGLTGLISEIIRPQILIDLEFHFLDTSRSNLMVQLNAPCDFLLVSNSNHMSISHLLVPI